MEIEWVVINVTAVGFPARTECANLEVILAGQRFGQFQGIFVVGEPLGDVGTSS